MANNIKTGIGYLVPVGAIIGFVFALMAENFIAAIIFAVAGILGWVLYGLIMDTELPENTDKFIFLFGFLLAIGVFLQFGLEQNMFGGYLIKEEGLIFGLMILLFTVLAGLLYQKRSPVSAEGLTSQEKDWIKAAVEKTDTEEGDPRIIVIKQDEKTADEDEDEEEDDDEEYPHPMYMYPPEYYEEDLDEDDDDEDDEEEDDE